MILTHKLPSHWEIWSMCVCVCVCVCVCERERERVHSYTSGKSISLQDGLRTTLMKAPELRWQKRQWKGVCPSLGMPSSHLVNTSLRVELISCDSLGHWSALWLPEAVGGGDRGQGIGADNVACLPVGVDHAFLCWWIPPPTKEAKGIRPL